MYVKGWEDSDVENESVTIHHARGAWERIRHGGAQDADGDRGGRRRGADGESAGGDGAGKREWGQLPWERGRLARILPESAHSFLAPRSLFSFLPPPHKTRGVSRFVPRIMETGPIRRPRGGWGAAHLAGGGSIPADPRRSARPRALVWPCPLPPVDGPARGAVQ